MRVGAEKTSRYWDELITRHCTFLFCIARRSASTATQAERHLRIVSQYWPDDAKMLTIDIVETTIDQIYSTASSYNRVLASVKKFLRWLSDRKHIKTNFGPKLAKRRVDRVGKGARYTLVDREETYSLWPDSDEKYRHLARLLYWTGIRPQQVRRLNENHIRLGGKTPYLVIEQGKTKPFPAPLIHQDAIDGALFIARHGGYCGSPKFDTLWRRTHDALKLEWNKRQPNRPPICWESFRKSRITQWVQEGRPIESVARWTGTSAKMIREYYLVISPGEGDWPEMIS